MNQKIFNNILFILVVILFLKQVSPEPDSTLYILKKYLNYFLYQIKKVLARLNLCQVEDFINIFFGVKNLNNKTTDFKSTYEIEYINYFKNNNPNLKEKEIFDFYYFIQTLITNNKNKNDIDFSNDIPNDFSQDEIEKIKLIILKKLNSSKYKFDNFDFEYIPKYYMYDNGRFVDPFVFNVISDYGKIRIFIDIDIKYDKNENKEFFIINNIKPLKMKQVLFSNQNEIKHFNSDIPQHNNELQLQNNNKHQSNNIYQSNNIHQSQDIFVPNTNIFNYGEESPSDYDFDYNMKV